MDMSAVLPIAEAAKVLGVSTQTIRRRIRAGTLEARKVSGSHGTSYRVILPDNAIARQDEVPDHVAAALVRSLTNLRAARVQIEILEEERSTLQSELRHLQRELASLRAHADDDAPDGHAEPQVHPRMRARGRADLAHPA